VDSIRHERRELLMPSRLDARLRRLEHQGQGTDTALAQGISGLLAYARTHHIAAVPIADLTDAELDAKITSLAAPVGSHCCSGRHWKRSAHGVR
jgi:hypothetical protein